MIGLERFVAEQVVQEGALAPREDENGVTVNLLLDQIGSARVWRIEIDDKVELIEKEKSSLGTFSTT